MSKLCAFQVKGVAESENTGSSTIHVGAGLNVCCDGVSVRVFPSYKVM